MVPPARRAMDAGTEHSAIIESEDLYALIYRLKLRPVDLVGVSYGAQVVCAEAIRAFIKR